jgi:transcriptional regulator with XRE-family HTH domain
MGATSQGVAGRFGDNMRRLRRQAGISQEALGERASLHRTEIGLIERGSRCPRIDTLVKIAAGLGVRIDCALFEGISWSGGETTTTPGEFTFATRQERHAEAMRLAAEAREARRRPTWSSCSAKCAANRSPTRERAIESKLVSSTKDQSKE